MHSDSPECQPRRSKGVFLSTLQATVVTTLAMTFAAGWAPGAHAAQDAYICPADRINSNGNICTASDVQLAQAAVGQGSEGGVCTPGEPIEVAIAGTVSLRKGDRYDIGIWVSTDGKPIELRGGTNGAPDEGGAQSCQVLPLPYEPILADGNVPPPVIGSFDDPNAIQDCYDTNANNNQDTSSAFLLTEPRDGVVNGLVDVNADGVITAEDSVPMGSPLPVLGAWIYSGYVDLNQDGVINNLDTGIWSGRNIENGVIDYNDDGVYGNNDGTDTAPQQFNDFLTVTCQAGPWASGNLQLDSLVTWNVPSDKANVCNPLDPDTYAAPNNKGEPSFNSSKCSVSSSQIEIQIGGKVTITKQATADPDQVFNFTYTNSLPTTVDSDGDPDNNLSVTDPFTLKDGESAEIWGVIGTRTIDGGPFVPAEIVVTEENLPDGWELNSIVCTGPEGADLAQPVIVDEVAGTATITLFYDEADYTLSQDDVYCTFVNDEAPGVLTVNKISNGGNDVFDFDWSSTNNPAPNAFTLDTSTGPNFATTDIDITSGLGDSDYAIAETLTAQQLTDGWAIESAQCVDSNDNDTPVGTVSIVDGVATVDGFTLDAGGHVTCTFVNNAAAQVTVTKVAQGGDDTFPFNSDLPFGTDGAFSLTTSGGNQNTGPIVVPVPDSGAGRIVNILENLAGLPNWNLNGIVCSGTTEQVVSNEVIFTLQPGDVVNCTFTNVADGNITINKHTLGGDGNFQFTTNVPGAASPFNIQTSNNTGTASLTTPPPGQYFVTENVPTGWDLTNIVCEGLVDSTVTYTGAGEGTDAFEPGDDTANVDLAAGEDISCTFTNTQRGQIVINKATDPVGSDVFGFTSTSGTDTPIPASFDVTAGTPVVFNNGGANLIPGNYTVTEDDPTPGYDLTTLVCVDSVTSGGTASSGDVPSRTGTINLDPGEVVTCTFTNAQRANLTIRKVVTADGPAVSDFDFSSTTLPDATFQLLGVTVASPGSTTYNNIEPGVYDVAEDEAAAMVNGWALTDASCDDGSTVDNIVLSPGENVTCTFTNAPLGSATITKNTVGGDDVFDFVGTAPFDGLQLDTSIIGGTASADFGYQLVPGTDYGIQEDPLPAGWSLTALNCIDPTDDTSVSLENRSATIRADYNETISCVFTNTLDGTITIRKETLPDGVDQTFTYSGELAGSIRDYSAFGEEIVNSLQPGTYSSTETVPDGWQITGISCDDSLAPGSSYTITNSTNPGGTDAWEPGDDTVNVTLAAGENVVCSFENTQESSITISKTVIGAGGTFNFGSAALGDFSLTPADNASDQQIFPNLLPGTVLVAENPIPTGYQLTNIVCTGNERSNISIGGNGVFDPGDTGLVINLEPGEDITCEFTNTELGSITVAKETLPDGSPASFTFTGNAAGSISDGGTIVVPNLLPATYTSTESALADWDLTDITCSDDDSVGDVPTATATFNVGPGEDVTCTFTNTQRASLVVVKGVLNDEGGNDTVADFNVSSTAGPLTFDGGVPNGDTTYYTATVSDLVPGTFQVSESDNPGYAEGTWSCDNGDTGPFGGADVTIDPGETVTCTIVNDDIAPTLTLTKVVNNNFNGTLGPNDFGISVGGNSVTSGAQGTYTANTALAIDETVQPGYEFVSITGDENCPGVLGGTITLDEGENASCTITNQDIAPDINMAKTVNGPAVLEADGSYTVVYTITVSNNSAGIGVYDLVDTFSPGAGITFNSASLLYVAGTENDQSGTITPTLTNGGTWVTNEGIGIGLNESWQVTANFTVDPAQVDETRTCEPGDPVINTGFYNAVSGVVNETNTDDNDTCTGLPDPDINLTKSVNGPATLETDGTYTVVYTVLANNLGQGPGYYDLTDTFSPANGVTVNTVSLLYQGGSENSQTGTLATPPLVSGGTWVTGEALAANRGESWLITANFTVDPVVVDPAARACSPGEPVINTGFYNAVSGVVNETNTDDNDTCTSIPDPALNLAKTVNGPATLELDDTYTVVYTVTATNSGQGAGAYDLTDTFSPASGVTFNSATLLYVPGTENSQTGTLASPPLTNGGTWVTGESLAAGMSESWTITANFSVDPAQLPDDERDCDPENAVNTGFYNYVEGVANEADLSDNDACTLIPVPAINLAKSAEAAVQVGPDTWQVTYTVTATNTGNGGGVYDVVDTLSPGTGIYLMTDASYPSITYGGGETQSGTIATPPLVNGGTWVTGESLGPDASETWVIVAQFNIVLAELTPTSADCVMGEGENGTGYYNYVEGSATDTDLSDNEACVPAIVLPDVPVPVNNPMMLLLMMMAMVAMAWYFRPAVLRRNA